MPNELETKPWTLGDRRTAIADTLRSAGGPVDLTGLTVKFRMVSQLGVVKVADQPATIDDAAAGDVSYPFAAGDVDTLGLFYYWWLVYNAAGTLVDTFPHDGRKRAIRFHAAG